MPPITPKMNNSGGWAFIFYNLEKMYRGTIYSRFSQWVARQPDAMAIVEDGRSVTYRELDAMANAIMSKFYSKQYPTVGVVMSHGIEMIAAMLAAIKSGAAYVPAEPTLPKRWMTYRLRAAAKSTTGCCPWS